jgi:hypothetical protein
LNTNPTARRRYCRKEERRINRKKKRKVGQTINPPIRNGVYFSDVSFERERRQVIAITNPSACLQLAAT